jgi:hypothetical protein
MGGRVNLMQGSSDLDVHRLADRMGVALPAYISFRNSPVWTAPSIPEEVPAEDAAASTPLALPETAGAAEPAPAVTGATVLHNLVMIPEPPAPPATRTATPAGGYPLIAAALAARPARG